MKKLFSLLLLLISVTTFSQVASWEFVESQSISAQDINTTPIEFNNLLGDKYDYKLYAIFYNGGTNQNIFLGCNGDQTGTNYRRQYMRGTTTTANASVSTSDPIYWTFLGTNTSYQEFATATVTGSSGEERAIDTFVTGHAGTDPYVIKESDYWQNTADEVNQLEIWSNTTTAVSGEIYLFKRPKSGVFQAEDWKIVERVEIADTSQGASTLLHMDGTDASTSFPDDTGNHTYTANGGAEVDTAQSVFGGASYIGDGVNGTFVEAPDSADWDLTGDFTIDFRLRFNTSTATSWLVSHGGHGFDVADSDGWIFYFDTTPRLVLRTKNGGASDLLTWSWSPSADTWYHIRLCRSSTTVYCFVDGTEIGSSQTLSGSINFGSSSFRIGASSSSDGGHASLDGWIDEFLLNNGTALSTSNFTSPTSAYTVGRNLNTDPINFLVQGDDKEYLIESHVDNDLLVRLNSDSGTNYIEQLLFNNAGTLTASTSSTDTSIQIATDTKLLIEANVGQYRPCLLSTGQTSANQQTEAGYWWANSSDAVNKLTISDGTSQNSTGVITLYERTGFKSSINAHERLIEEYDISGDFSAGYTFSNLPQDENAIYKVVVNMEDNATDENLVYMRLNSDSGANYGRQFLRGQSTTASASSSTTNQLFIGVSDDTYSSLTECYIFPKTGKYRPILYKQLNGFGGTLTFELNAYWWLNTSDSIEEIQFIANDTDSITGKIQLYKIPLK